MFSVCSQCVASLLFAFMHRAKALVSVASVLVSGRRSAVVWQQNAQLRRQSFELIGPAATKTRG